MNNPAPYSSPGMMPQVNFPQQQIGPAARAASIIPRKRATVSFELYLNNMREYLKAETLKSSKAVEMSVTLHRRYRGLTLDDMCGRYGTRQKTNGRWMSYDADLDGEIHPINIVQPAMRANTDACLQSNPIVEIDAANQENAKMQNIARRWQRIADYWEAPGETFTEDERSLIFDAVQKDGTVLIDDYAEVDDSQSVPTAAESKQSIAQFRCRGCGQEGIMPIPGEVPEGMTQIPCPKCQQPADAIVKGVSSFDVQEQEVPTVKITSDIIPFYNFTIDRLGAKLKGIDGAKWLKISRLRDKVYFDTKYPQHQFDTPHQWSYPIQCDYALACADWRYLNFQPVDSGSNFVPDFALFEEETIYLHEEAYSNYVAPQPFEFVNAKGELVFKIEADQTIAEAWEAMYGFNPKGLKFVWEGDRLIDIVSPVEDQVNFRERFKDVHWLRDSSGYISSPNYSITYLQDDITMINTMDHNITARNAVIPVYYDSLVFEDADFSKEYIGSKNANLLGENRDLTKSVFSLDVPTPSPHLAARMAFLWEVKDSVSQVTPAMRGEAQKGETFGAQRQQLEQSYGSLTSVLKSYAKMKITRFKQRAKIAKDKWTLEQFQAAGSAFGEIWTDEEVSEMCDIDLDRDLRCSYRDGSEMPEGNMARELKFFNGLTQLFAFGPEVVFELLGPQKVNKLIEQIDQYAKMGFDLSGLEVSELVAQKRYIELAQLCKQFGEVTFEQIEQLRDTVIALQPGAVDQTGMQAPPEPITQLDTITERIFYASKIRFSEYDDLEQQKLFFIEQYRNETGKTNPNWLLLEMLQVLLGFLDMAVQQIQMQQMLANPEVQMALEQNAEAKTDAKNSEKEAADREDKNRKEDRQAAQEDQSTQFAQKLIGDGMAQDADIQKTALQGAMAAQKPAAKKK
jgi:hypothetical protein